MRYDKLALIIVVLGAVLVVGSASWLLFSRSKPSTTIYIGDAVLSAEVAKTQKQREQGLSGRPDLPTNAAMLFVFDNDGKWPIWMKDMQMSLDIIWLDADQKVVHVKNNVKPETYPDTFVPSSPARYVLEVPAGTAEAKNIRAGIQARFETPQ